MTRRNDEADLIAVHRHDLEALFIDRQLREAEVGGIIEDGLDHMRAIGPVDLELHGRKMFAVLGEDPRQDINAGGFVSGDDELAPRVAFQLGDSVLSAAAEVEQLLRVSGENAAGDGQRDAAAEALEQIGAELLLELPDLRADSGLRAVARLSGFGKTLE